MSSEVLGTWVEDDDKLRFRDGKTGEAWPTAAEKEKQRAEKEKQRAEQAKQRADNLAKELERLARAIEAPMNLKGSPQSNAGANREWLITFTKPWARRQTRSRHLDRQQRTRGDHRAGFARAVPRASRAGQVGVGGPGGQEAQGPAAGPVLRSAGGPLRAGVPSAVFAGNAGQADSQPVLKAILTEVQADVSEGHSLGDALARHPRAFNELIVSMVRAGPGGRLSRRRARTHRPVHRKPGRPAGQGHRRPGVSGLPGLRHVHRAQCPGDLLCAAV